MGRMRLALFVARIVLVVVLLLIGMRLWAQTFTCISCLPGSTPTRGAYVRDLPTGACVHITDGSVTLVNEAFCQGGPR